MRASFQLQITKVREALMGYAARFGAEDTEVQRTVAARLWRAVPRSLGPTDTLAEAEHAISQWATELIRHPVTAAQLRVAMLAVKADPLLLLAAESEELDSFAARVAPALLMPLPPATPVDMPVQSLTSYTRVKAAPSLQQVQA